MSGIFAYSSCIAQNRVSATENENMVSVKLLFIYCSSVKVIVCRVFVHFFPAMDYYINSRWITNISRFGIIRLIFWNISWFGIVRLIFRSYGTSEKNSELWDLFKIRNCATYFSEVWDSPQCSVATERYSDATLTLLWRYSDATLTLLVATPRSILCAVLLWTFYLNILNRMKDSWGL
jgi:hypothetical protein